MSKLLFRAIDEGNLPALQEILGEDPDAVRALKVMAEAPSLALDRKVVSALEWAILRRSVSAVEALLSAAPLGEHGRDPDGPVQVLLEILGDDWAEIHLPDRDRYTTVRDALPPPSGMTPTQSLRAIGQITVLMDKAGVDWARLHGRQGRPRVEHLNLHPSSPAHALLDPIVQRVRAQQSLVRGRRPATR
jgi:hypothetical protein